MQQPADVAIWQLETRLIKQLSFWTFKVSLEPSLILIGCCVKLILAVKLSLIVVRVACVGLLLLPLMLLVISTVIVRCKVLGIEGLWFTILLLLAIKVRILLRWKVLLVVLRRRREFRNALYKVGGLRGNEFLGTHHWLTLHIVCVTIRLLMVIFVSVWTVVGLVLLRWYLMSLFFLIRSLVAVPMTVLLCFVEVKFVVFVILASLPTVLA